jgi:nucleoside 2-deoxyribosyltransferase
MTPPPLAPFPPSRPHRIYVAAPLPLLHDAREAAAFLTKAGLTVTSSWHALADDPTPEKEHVMARAEQSRLANTCLSEIDDSDALLLLVGPRSDRCGNVGEAFFAAGRGLHVFVLQHRADAVLPTILLTSDLFHKPTLIDLVVAMLSYVPLRTVRA